MAATSLPSCSIKSRLRCFDSGPALWSFHKLTFNTCATSFRVVCFAAASAVLSIRIATWTASSIANKWILKVGRFKIHTTHNRLIRRRYTNRSSRILKNNFCRTRLVKFIRRSTYFLAFTRLPLLAVRNSYYSSGVFDPIITINYVLPGTTIDTQKDPIVPSLTVSG